jgi:propanol-preferring alcohol dehydrogenase
MASSDLPKKYKAIIYDKPGSISTKIEELDMPEPGPGEVLINLCVSLNNLPTHLTQLCISIYHNITNRHRTHSGVCHSDMGVMTNSWSFLPAPTQAGQVGGHEGVGKVVQMGPGTEKSAVKVGDRVGIKWMAGICESCEACRAGMDANCFNGVRIFPLPPLSENEDES